MEISKNNKVRSPKIGYLKLRFKIPKVIIGYRISTNKITKNKTTENKITVNKITENKITGNKITENKTTIDKTYDNLG